MRSIHRKLSDLALRAASVRYAEAPDDHLPDMDWRPTYFDELVDRVTRPYEEANKLLTMLQQADEVGEHPDAAEMERLVPGIMVELRVALEVLQAWKADESEDEE